jgi:hypothetical protein
MLAVGSDPSMMPPPCCGTTLCQQITDEVPIQALAPFSTTAPEILHKPDRLTIRRLRKIAFTKDAMDNLG